MQSNLKRCAWCGDDKLMTAYHDREWGVPLHNDRRLFEMLCLEGAQAGLSWTTILRKRNNYRRAFDNFDAKNISRYRRSKESALLRDSGIVRNKLKIRAAIENAKAFLAVRKEFGTFDAFIWKFVNYRPIQNSWKRASRPPASTRESEAMSGELRRRGFRFVGPTICYAFMQATGMVNDHLVECFRHRELM